MCPTPLQTLLQNRYESDATSGHLFVVFLRSIIPGKKFSSLYSHGSTVQESRESKNFVLEYSIFFFN